MTDYKYQTIAETLQHIDLVCQYLESVKLELAKRQYSHDRSKLENNFRGYQPQSVL